MLQDQVSLRFGDETCTPVSGRLWRISLALTAVVKSFPVATSKGIRSYRQLHAGDGAKGDHLRAEGAVG